MVVFHDKLGIWAAVLGEFFSRQLNPHAESLYVAEILHRLRHVGVSVVGNSRGSEIGAGYLAVGSAWILDFNSIVEPVYSNRRIRGSRNLDA